MDMEKTQGFAVDNFLSNWNGDFPDYPLSAEDLNKPHAIMGALLQLFDRLGIDRNAVIRPPPEESRNEHTVYYWDLLPVINMTRVINHLVSVMPQVDASISVTHFLQPTVTTSHSILLLLFNLMVFNEERLREIAPAEEELFSKADQVKILNDKKNRLLEMLNEQAEEKGKRKERMDKLNEEIKLLEEELKQEKEGNEEDKLELEAIRNENHQIQVVLEQKKVLRDTVLAEVARKRAERVYDADDIKAQAEQAAQNVQEAEEKLNSLRATLMQKENSLKNLQTIKPSLETANSVLHEIMKVAEELKETVSKEPEGEGEEGELDGQDSEQAALEAALAQLRAERTLAEETAQKARDARQQEKMVADNELKEAEEEDKKCRESCKMALERTQEIKDLTIQYEAEKNRGLTELAKLETDFVNGLKSAEEALLSRAMQVEKIIEVKLRNRNI